MFANTLPNRQLDQPSGEVLAGRPSTLPDVHTESHTSSNDVTELQGEELPSYEAPAPSYNRELHEAPLHTYYLRAPDKKNLMVVPYGPSSSASYKITSRSSRPFSKKPEMEMWRSIRASLPSEDEYVAGMWFDTDGPLPWCPRARFIHHDPTKGNQMFKMESRNFSDWTMSVDGTLYAWTLEAKPFSLVLRQNERQDLIARFNFSIHGLTATGGEEAGDLTIYQDRLSQGESGVDVLLCSMITALLQYKKMGRHYKNEPDAISDRIRSSEERVPHHRNAIPQFWGYQQG